jgi:hypothetical protein
VAVTISEAGEAGVAVPLPAETVSQDSPEEVVAFAVKDSDPLPLFNACNCCVRAPLPWVAVKLRFCASTPSAAALSGRTVKVTATVVVAGPAFGAVMVTVP